jgi:hypothetical protein
LEIKPQTQINNFTECDLSLFYKIQRQHAEDGQFAQSETLWLTEDLCKIKTPGCFVVAFSPDSIKIAFENACRASDEFYNSSPTARQSERESAAIAGTVTGRQSAYNFQRAKKLAEKYGAANLSAEWQQILVAKLG